jgi:hypothetical protein
MASGLDAPRTRQEPAREPKSPGWLRSVTPWLLVGIVLASAAVRIGVATSMPYLHDRPAEGLLKSDPGLIHYLTRQIVEAQGRIPSDFRSDPRIEHPELTDVPAMFTVGQEFLVAWTHLALGGAFPLHAVAMYIASLVAALGCLGVFGMTRELTRSRGWALLAAGLYALSPANYRTIGFLYSREDFSLPLLSIHLWLLLRAVRTRRAAPMAGAAVAAGAALASWHAMTFVFSVEVACLLAWWLRSGRSPIAAPWAWLHTALLGAMALCIPVLNAKLFLLSPAYAALVAMTLAPWLEPRLPAGAVAKVGARLLFAAVLVASARALATQLGAEDYQHVFDLMVAKLRYLGQRPADPTLLPFDVRMLWQGPFSTGSPTQLWWGLGVLCLGIPAACLLVIRSWWRGRGEAGGPVSAAFAAATLLLALLVSRLLAVAGLIAPVVSVTALRTLATGTGSSRRLGICAGLLAVQLAVFWYVVPNFGLRLWYNESHQAALIDMVRFVRSNLPRGAVIATDYVNSTALLAHTDARVVLQPKYETARSRRRIERFELAFHHESPEAFAEILRREFDADYLLVDTAVLWFARYEAGLSPKRRRPIPGTAAAALMARDLQKLGEISGYRLLAVGDRRTSRMRLFELLEANR